MSKFRKITKDTRPKTIMSWSRIRRDAKRAIQQFVRRVKAFLRYAREIFRKCNVCLIPYDAMSIWCSAKPKNETVRGSSFSPSAVSPREALQSQGHHISQPPRHSVNPTSTNPPTIGATVRPGLSVQETGEENEGERAIQEIAADDVLVSQGQLTQPATDNRSFAVSCPVEDVFFFFNEVTVNKMQNVKADASSMPTCAKYKTKLPSEKMSIRDEPQRTTRSIDKKAKTTFLHKSAGKRDQRFLSSFANSTSLTPRGKQTPIEKALKLSTHLRIRRSTTIYVYPMTAHHDIEDYEYDEVLDMFKERHRFMSFHNAHHHLRQNEWVGPLSEDGYYFDRQSTTIKCFYCKSPPTHHRSFCNRGRCNEPMFQSRGPRNIRQNDCIRIMGAIPREGELPEGSQGGGSPYRNMDGRVTSLRIHCPSEDANALASAGFYATRRDNVVCFSCGLIKTVQELRVPPRLDVDAHEHVMQVHRTQSPRCRFLFEVLAVTLRQDAMMPPAQSAPEALLPLDQVNCRQLLPSWLSGAS
ncbi:uncharacterized protein [Littorina saxatilis]|uniref:uncharacterized protein n=1 Tax=Littorina saxatilis TaxID=31220 RepID=UPI0038B47974